MLRGWCVTVVVGAFSINTEKNLLSIYLILYFTIILFWLLDSYYLNFERAYRELYDKFANKCSISRKRCGKIRIGYDNFKKHVYGKVGGEEGKWSFSICTFRKR